MATPGTAGAGAGATSTLTATRPGSVDDDTDFPIEGYNNLRASQILAHLEELSLDELDMVREREEQGKNRATIIKRVDIRIDELEAEEDGSGDTDGTAAAPDVASTDGGAGEFPAASPGGPAGEDDDDDFPIAGYDQLSADEIISRLDDLDDDELDMVAEREEQGRNRVEILDYIDDMFEEVGQDGEPIVAPAPSPVSPRPAPKKAAAKVAPVKKVAGKKVGAAKVGAAKVGASKVGASKVGASKVGAAKVGASKVGATAAKRVVKAAPVTKAPTRKATPVASALGTPPGKKAAATASPGTKSVGRKAAGTVKAPAAPRTAAKKSVAKIPGTRAPAAKRR